jgi:hypothetical protein
MPASIPGKTASRKSELAQVLKATPGGAPAELRPRIRLHASRESARIGRHRLSAYELDDGSNHWRLWYAGDLPKPPHEVRRRLAAIAPLDGKSLAVMHEIAGQQPLRVELRGPAGWKTILDTTAILPVEVKSSGLAPPSGYETGAAGAVQAAAATTATAIRGPGPVMSNVEVYSVYWGPGRGRCQFRGRERDGL